MRTNGLALCAGLALGVVVLGGCGVTAEDEPRPLTTAPTAPAPTTPTLTQRPDPSTTTSSSTPSSTSVPGPTGR